MHVGITIFPTDYSISPADVARAVEARGFDSLWLPEHSHMPVELTSAWPGGPEVPKPYYDVYEPFISLAAAAAVTSHIKLATGICLVVQRDPIQTAKDVATLDRVSNGRFLFGIGGGWNAAEMRDHGTDFTTRFALMRERVLAMKELWTQTKAEYHGRFVDFPPTYAWPKPVQTPHPPIHVGGAWPHALRRAIEYADGWIPILGRGPIIEKLPEIRAQLRAAGKDADGFEVTLFGIPPDGELLARARDAGVARCVLGLPSAKDDAVLPVLDRHVALMEKHAR
jgi:probable F420-dependent oxidoreductase